MANIGSVRSETTYTVTLSQKEFDVILAVLSKTSVVSTNCALESIQSRYRETLEEDTGYDLYCQFKQARGHM